MPEEKIGPPEPIPQFPGFPPHIVVELDPMQFVQWMEMLGAIRLTIEAVYKQLKSIEDAIDNNTKVLKAGFTQVAEAIANVKPLPPPQPEPKMKGSIMSDYQIPADLADGRVSYAIKAVDSEGNPITDPEELAKLVLDLKQTNEDAFRVVLDKEQPDPANRVGKYHVGGPGQCAITQNLMTGVRGEVIATGTDGFTVTTGTAALGSVTGSYDGMEPLGSEPPASAQRSTPPNR